MNKIRILILGGASGDVGRDVTRVLLLEKTHIAQITVTARKQIVAENFVKEVGDKRVKAVQVDVTDSHQLMNAFKDHDLVINTIGPFSRYALFVMNAAITSKINYIDICDDIEPTFKALQLDKNAKEAGIFLLIGMGWFPGMSNLRAKALAEQMDVVDEIVTAWVAGRKSREKTPSYGSGGTEHFLRSLTGKIITFRNGQKVKITPFQKGIRIRFPEPLGVCNCFPIEHPEPVVLPLTIPSVQNASTLYSLYPASRNRLIRFFARMIDIRFLSVSLVTKIFRILGNTDEKKHFPILTGAYIACKGVQKGKKGQLWYSSVNTNTTVAEATSQPLACVVFNLVSGGSLQPGVHLPEQVFGINDLLEIGKKYDFSFVKDVVETTTWEM
jgi:saccharopine dehydrogenase-like NADP-dependent oxidoreductase